MDSGILTEEILRQAVYEHYIHQVLQVLPATFLFWDHIVTFESEIRYIWSHPKSRSSYFFFIVRYFGLFSMMTVIAVGFYPLSKEACSHYVTYRVILYMVTHVVVFLFLSLRLYAIFSCDNRILVLMGVSAVVLLGLATYMIAKIESVHFPLRNICHEGVTSESSRRLTYAWITVFVYDTILFFLLATRTFRYYLRTRHDPGHIPLLSLVFRDGAIYFGVVALSTLPNILTYWICGPFMRGALSSFTSCISVTMVCRLMLNLHASGLSTRSSVPGQPSITNSPMEFAAGGGTMAVSTASIVFDSVFLDDSDSDLDSEYDDGNIEVA